MTDTQIALLGGINVEGDAAIARMDSTGRLLVICPCCAREGKTEPGALVNVVAEWGPRP